MGFPCCSRFSFLLFEPCMFNIVKEAFIPLPRTESLVVSSGTLHLKLLLEQRLLNSWWSDRSLKYCCRSAFATQGYATYLQGDINTSATRNHKKLLWFAVSLQGLNSIQMYVSGLCIFVFRKPGQNSSKIELLQSLWQKKKTQQKQTPKTIPQKQTKKNPTKNNAKETPNSSIKPKQALKHQNVQKEKENLVALIKFLYRIHILT